VRSDTGDLTGDLSETGETTTREAVAAVLPGFLGVVVQQVPMTSAVKVDGERLYKKAHRGEVVETPLKELQIDAIDVLEFDAATQMMHCRVACSKGTYVRQLAIDIGEAVGAGAHLVQLSRAATGDLRLDDAQTLAAFEEAVAAREPGDERIPGLVDPAAALRFMPGIELSAAQVTAVRNGARLPGGPLEPVRLTYRGELIAIYGPTEEGHALKLLVKV
jgi:tRNA pseudouridine55 synthase